MKQLKQFLLFAFVISSLVIIAGCAGGKITVDQAYRELTPVKQLELPEQITDNLVIKISNVADDGSSYKNHLNLYINDKLIQPDWAVSNIENTFTYKLKLKPGYYKVRAEYFAYIGWGEEKFSIMTQKLVRITHDRRTFLKCNIAKEPNGTPVNKKMYFKVNTEPLVMEKSESLTGVKELSSKKGAGMISPQRKKIRRKHKF
ncbi:MAG: hypothetical protein GXO75_08710 [Calditrichaeota bacterium]|nr:hypothetical protein [Calditrichota bacterium]